MHSLGCRRWFNVVRDTTTYEILATYRLGSSRPVVAGMPGDSR
jgi:sarcosine oxidase, subunit delta